MKAILISRENGSPRSVELGSRPRALVSLCCLGLPLGLLVLGYFVGQGAQARDLRDSSLDILQDQLAAQSIEFDAVRPEAERKLQAMTMDQAELRARMSRLDALGEHLTAMAILQNGEFDFSQQPAIGGPLAGEFSVEYLAPDLTGELQTFANKLDQREQQLEILESLLTHRKLDEQASISGRPVEKGWISSGFGSRTDPFTGKRAAHYGIDFAGKHGSNVIAVAGGVVTFAGKDDSGYGRIVEVSHADGLVTRYAHNQENLVEPGDLVRKGQPVALMGSSGRATGPHVHFEVYKHGRPVDPSSYVHRTHR